MKEKTLSPMMGQYFKIKEQNPDSILFFRLGDFYEMFYEDAKVASEELDLTLTGRDCGQEERAPMCGVPYHSAESYIARLVARGYRVAICEQTEDPAKATKLVRREVVNVISPGTVIEDSMLDASRNNYLCALSFSDGQLGLCFVDASTGLLHLTELGGNDVDQRAICELGRFSPREMILTKEAETHPEILSFAETRINCRVTRCESSYFSAAAAEELILKHFNAVNLGELNLKAGTPAVAALGGALSYLYETRRQGLETISKIDYYTDNQYMRLDLSAMRNLELCETLRGGSRKGSLLWVIDKTKTAMGKRRLRGMIEQPLREMSAIEARLNAVEELYDSAMVRGEIREALCGVRDFERLMARVIFGTAGAKELNTLADTLSAMPAVREQLKGAKSKLLRGIFEDIDPLEEITARIRATLKDEPAAVVREGGIIRDGFSPEVDELRNDFSDGKSFIVRIETTERERTGIKNLKVRYNKVFGYYIEVPASFKGDVPEDYIRKQTLTNCERYITDELKNLESRVLGARERVNQLEYEIFDKLRTAVAAERVRILKTADAVARLDVLCALSEAAVQGGYCRPKLNTEGKLRIRDGRHPVVEKISKIPFVPNDTSLDENDDRCAIITGPNMAGKSTYMRQVAIIVILTQIGSFVPALSADISICDAVYTRVGASDDLAAGQSTFMVEMSEVAYILKNATKHSLLILDEIGRGTSTFDGMAIARAVLEYCADKKRLGAKTLFATHYHELTALEEPNNGIKNYNIAVKKHGDDITFLRKIVRGGADDSYGIEVAKLSGIPKGIINRAKEVLKELETEGVQMPAHESAPVDDQLTLTQLGAQSLLDELKLCNINAMTPIDALNALSGFVEKAKNI